MLLGLTIRDVVLIDRLELSFRPGLCVLTGETGAGKSILLDALGLALGVRAESGLVRPGAEQAVVSAEFALGYVVVAAIAHVMWREELNAFNLGGMGLIVIGVALLHIRFE